MKFNWGKTKLEALCMENCRDKESPAYAVAEYMRSINALAHLGTFIHNWTTSYAHKM